MIDVKSFTEFLACNIISGSGVATTATPPPPLLQLPRQLPPVAVEVGELPTNYPARRLPDPPSLANFSGLQCQEKGWVLDDSEDDWMEKGRPPLGQTKQAIETE